LLERFGSHVKLGPFELGGWRRVRSRCDYKSSENQKEIETAISNKLNAKVEAEGWGVKASVEGGTENNGAYGKSDSLKKAE